MVGFHPNVSDLSLQVKGYKSLEESLDKYVEVEIMDGANKYEAGFTSILNTRGPWPPAR